VSLVVIIAAGAGWYFTRPKDGAAHVEEVKVVPAKPPIFVVFEPPFVVNLQRESSDQYLQLGLTFKLFEVDIEKKIKDNQPEIRSKILQLLTTKTASELLSAEGKTKLVKEILTLGNAVIGVVDTPPVPAAAGAHGEASPAASAVSEAGTENQPSQPADAAASAPKPAVKVAPEKKGIVDVLFTSFIIQ